ncbi:MAG: LCP family protein [Tepidanaerobacteraceae bacterium]|nr:LCP family protein [Thermoanaerobacterales bacterium]
MKRPLKILLFILIFIVLSMGSGFYYVARNLNDSLDPNIESPSSTDELDEHGRQNILVLGLDAGTIGAKEEYNRYRSDTIIVVSLDKKNKDIHVLSIPRDTRVRIPGVGIDKINAAMAYGGSSLAVKTVRDFLGVPIHNYVVVKLSSFRNIVDVLGGIEMEIKEDMKYIDPSVGGVRINIPAGKQILDGELAEQFVRYRSYPDADIGRVKAQQEFMKALTKTVLRPGTLLKLPQIINEIQNNVETDIQPLEMVSIGNIARKIKQEDIKMHMVPGEGKYISNISYFIPYQEQFDELINEIFFDESDIKVAVLNGNGTKGVASKVANQLETQGFRVVSIANADSFDYDTTTIIYPKGKKDDAEKIAKVFNEVRMQEEDENSIEFPTIIVGKDVK